MPLPPLKNTIEALLQDVLPAAGGATLIMCLFLLLGRRAAAIGSATAIVFAFVWANFSLDNSISSETGNLVWANTYRLLPWKVDPSSTSVWHSIPRAALILVIVGLLSRWCGLLAFWYLHERRLPGATLAERGSPSFRLWWGANLLVWLPRISAVFVVSGWLVSEKDANESPWPRFTLVATMLLIWFILDVLARVREGGEIAAYLAMSLYAAGVVLLFSHSARFMEIAVSVGSAMFEIAIAARVSKAYVSGAIPAGVAFLPGLILASRPSLPTTEVPAISYWLVALAPLALAPFLIPFLSRKNGWYFRLIRAVLVLVPLVIAVVLAAQHEQLPFDEE